MQILHKIEIGAAADASGQTVYLFNRQARYFVNCARASPFG